jgi:membrane protein implicated in regulation of membrane protease activity
MSDSVNYWLMLPEVWVVFGIVLIMLEVLLGAAYFLLALGVAALLLSLTLFSQGRWDFVFLTDWMDIAFLYGILSLLAVGVLKKFVQDNASSEDINKY